ncbi:hypothetical protein HBA_0738 [Sodalis endosymbiont of Henestaris halophilus]|nr:hypothetical protein HBA_0738 [Sodalis endosymbiont of Henestaris halophilus]
MLTVIIIRQLLIISYKNLSENMIKIIISQKILYLGRMLYGFVTRLTPQKTFVKINIVIMKLSGCECSYKPCVYGDNDSNIILSDVIILRAIISKVWLV